MRLNVEKEMFYLIDNGEKYVFVKTHDNITTWKFKKNKNLFRLLSEYYKNIEDYKKDK